MKVYIKTCGNCGGERSTYRDGFGEVIKETLCRCQCTNLIWQGAAYIVLVFAFFWLFFKGV
jgi:hypothetical protein